MDIFAKMSRFTRAKEAMEMVAKHLEISSSEVYGSIPDLVIVGAFHNKV